MQLFSWIRRLFASIMPSPREPAIQRHLIHEELKGISASQALRMLLLVHSAPELLGHVVVAEMQLWKKTKVPEHEFIVVRVVQVKDANTRPPFAKGSELASSSILIDRNANNDRSTRTPIWNFLRSNPLSSKSSAASVTTLATADPEPIAGSYIHSVSAPDLPSAARTHEYPPLSMDDAPLAGDDGARSSLWSGVSSRDIMRASSTSSDILFGKPAYDRFSVHPGKSIKDLTSNKGALCMATMDFTNARRPLLFEELAMMAKVTSDSAVKYSTATSQCYWYAASIWKITTLYTGAASVKVDHPRLQIGALSKVFVPDKLFGVDLNLQPEELLRKFLPEWEGYKAELIQLGKSRQEESDQKLAEAESRVQEARNETAEARNRIAELERMLAQRDGAASA